MGGADYINVLYSQFLNFDPDDMTWANRDRFFLDPGHMSPMLYSMLSLIGTYSMEDLKNFRQWGSVTPGHPEVDFKRGVENTSGPLGQGHAMAVGAAIAERFLVARFGEWMAHKTYAFISDGGIQEEISQGAGRIAGTLGLSNLITGIDYIISCDAVPRIDDLRVIANKAVVKGTVSISALYGVHTDEHSGCDELEKMSADIPVSQILDMPGLSDQHSCTPEFIVRNCELVPKSDSGVISCELKMECRCSAVQTSTVAIPCDAYSTEYETELTTASLKIPTDQRRADSQTSVKSTVACDGGEVDSIWDCRGELCSVSCRPDGENGLLVTGQVCMTVIGKCAGGTPFVAEKQEAFEHTIPVSNVTPDTSVNCRASVSNTGFAIRSDGSVDVTVQADISAELTDSRQFSVISSAAVHQDKPKERSDEFALRICYTTGHESCWDIAKRCGTTVEAVMEENEIADRSAELSGMVVIPIV